MITGIDIGNGWVKFDGMRFASKVRIGTLPNFGTKAEEKHQAVYEGTDYVVGEGNIFVGDGRYSTIEYKICLLTAIAIMHGNKRAKHIQVKMCAGVPLGAFKRVGSKLTAVLKSIKDEEITVNGRTVTITIEDAMVFVEGAYPLLVKDKLDGNVITIDVGAGTVNVTEWQGQTPVNKKTYNDAFYKMQDSIATMLSDKLGLTDINMDTIEQYMGKKSIETVRGTIDISDHIKIMESTIQGICSQIKIAFGTTTARKIHVIGGGGISTADLWEKYLGAKLVEETQFINSRIYKGIAVKKYGN